MRTRSLWLLLAGLVLTGSAWSQTPIIKTDREVLMGPPSKEEAPTWLTAMRQWREERLSSMHYSGAEYDRAELKWTRIDPVWARIGLLGSHRTLCVREGVELPD